jgi:hypothetical protein
MARQFRPPRHIVASLSTPALPPAIGSGCLELDDALAVVLRFLRTLRKRQEGSLVVVARPDWNSMLVAGSRLGRTSLPPPLCAPSITAEGW